MSQPAHEIQHFLYQQARRFPSRPFDHLMRHLTDWTLLKTAWQRVRSSQGAGTPGADRVVARDLPNEPATVRLFLQDLADQLQSGNYTPGPVRRFEIAKAGRPDKTRTLAILNVTDRVVHMALKLVLEPIVEARLGRRCFGFRPGRSRHDQLQAIRRMLIGQPDRYAAALSADVASCFDELDHGLILEDVAAVVSDQALVRLFGLVLGQVGSGRRGWWRRRPVGILQGSPLSPLLANWNLVRFDRAWWQRYGESAPLFRYADDLLLLARSESDAARLRRPLKSCLWHSNRLHLAAGKTRVATLDQGIALLGLVIRRRADPFSGRPEVRIGLDAAQVRKLMAEIGQWVEALNPDRPLGRQFGQLNQRLRGCFETYQYACDAPEAFEVLDRHLFVALRRRLKALLGCSGATLSQQYHRRLASGHDTWEADGERLIVLGALPRKCYRPRLPRPPWDVPADRAAVPPPPRDVVPVSPSLPVATLPDPIVEPDASLSLAEPLSEETGGLLLAAAATSSNGEPQPPAEASAEGPHHASP